jgi:hypothetical protein
MGSVLIASKVWELTRYSVGLGEQLASAIDSIHSFRFIFTNLGDATDGSHIFL